MLPNYPYPFFSEIFSKEVAWSYSYLPVAEPSVRLVHDVGYPEQRRVRLLEPPAKQAFDRWLVGEERGEVESPALGGVDRFSIYDNELVQRTLGVLERIDSCAIDERLAEGWLDEINAGSVSERWEREFHRASETIHKVCLERLFPTNLTPELQKIFYEAFDGVEVVPSSLESKFATLEIENPLQADELMVTVSWAQYKTAERKGLVRLSDDWPKIVDLPYDEEYGLRLDVGGGHGL